MCSAEPAGSSHFPKASPLLKGEHTVGSTESRHRHPKKGNEEPHGDHSFPKQNPIVPYPAHRAAIDPNIHNTQLT